MGLCDALCSHVERLTGVSTSKISLKEFTAQRNPFVTSRSSRSYAVEKSHRFTHQHTHTHTHLQQNILYSIQQRAAQPENNCQTRSSLRRPLGESSWDGSVQCQSNNGWEFLYGWAPPNKTFFFFFWCWLELFVPSAPCEVNRLMDRPWTRDLFNLIHLSLKTLQEQIKAKGESLDNYITYSIWSSKVIIVVLACPY